MTTTNEPITLSVALGGLLTTGVALVAVFVPQFGQAAQIAIIAFGNAAILTASILYARAHSTPTAAPVLPENARVTVTTPEGHPNGVATLGVTTEGDVTVSNQGGTA
jgi:hypothetical protein